MDTPIQLIVGLGNPGQEYEQTRHNAGFDFVESVANQFNGNLALDKKFFGLYGKALIGTKSIHLLNPQTFMNRSGKAVAAVAQFYKIPPEAILVVHDELDLPPGVAKLKLGGGHGGHNGLRDTIQCLGNNRNFARLRLGIGHPGDAKQVTGYVLKKAPKAEFEDIEDAIQRGINILPELTKGAWNDAMKRLHTVD